MDELLRKGYEREKRCQVAVQQSEESRTVVLLSLMLEFEKCLTECWALARDYQLASCHYLAITWVAIFSIVILTSCTYFSGVLRFR
jgi:hypothetical protein